MTNEKCDKDGVPDFVPNQQFVRLYFESWGADRNLTSTGRRNKEMENYYKDLNKKNKIETKSVLEDESICQLVQEVRKLEVFDPVADVKERQQRDSVHNIFQLPRGKIQSSTHEAFRFNKPMFEQIKGRDTEYVTKRDGFTLYNEELLKFKDNIRS